MKKYTIVLTGGKALEVDKERKLAIEEIWRNKSERLINIDGNTISAAMIRGIFEKNVEDVTQSNAKFQHMHDEFEGDCKRLSLLSNEEKVQREMDTRIFPEALIRIGWIQEGVNAVYEEIKQTLKDFFVANPKFPRCPARFWFPILRPYVSESVAEFYKVVGRNDEEVLKWAKNNGIRLNPSFQTSSNDIPF